VREVVELVDSGETQAKEPDLGLELACFRRKFVA
jgi:hypothetical protein